MEIWKKRAIAARRESKYRGIAIFDRARAGQEFGMLKEDAANAGGSKRVKLAKTWVFLTSAVSVLFAVIGFVMIFIDPEPRYLNGSMYLVSAASFAAAVCVLARRKQAMPEDSGRDVFFMQGFVLQVLGVGPLFSGEWVVARIAGTAVWAIGVSMLAVWFVKAFSKKL